MQITFTNKEYRLIKVLLSIFLIAETARVLSIINWIKYFIPILFIVFLLIVLKKTRQTGARQFFKLIFIRYWLFLLYPFYTILTAIWAFAPSVTLKFGLLNILTMIALSITSILVVNLKSEDILKLFLPANLLLLIASLIALIFNIPNDAWVMLTAKAFKGFGGHPNALATAILFTIPGLFSLTNPPEKKANNNKIISLINAGNINLRERINNNKRVMLFVLLLILNSIVLIATYSRANLLAFGVAILLITFLRYRKLFFAIIISTTITIIVITSLNLYASVENLITKNSGSLFANRIILWEASYAAAKAGGLWGIGYGLSNQSILTQHSTGSIYDNGIYFREKGNLELALIEEIGIIGLIFWLLPILLVFNRALRSIKTMDIVVVIIVFLIALLINYQFEAWLTPNMIHYHFFYIYLLLCSLLLDINLNKANHNLINNY